MDNKVLIQEMRQAIKKNDLETVKNLIEQNKELLKVETVFGTFLHDAALFGVYDIAKFFIDCGIDINKKSGLRKSSAIASAASEGHLDIVKLLFENGAVLDVSTPEGNPLLAAIPDNNIEVAKFLIDHGIDITAKYDIGEIENCDAMEYARQYGRTEIYNYLKEKKINDKK